MKTFNISVVLPIKSALAKNFDEYFLNAVSSVLKQKKEINELIVVHTAEENLVEKLKSFDFSGITVNLLQYDGEPNFCSQVNYGVENCNSEWFSILEFDDEYSPIWFDNVDKYLNHFDNVEIFLPIVIDIDTKGTFAGFTNEATFASSFTTEIGILDNEILHSYQNFQIAGMVMKKDKFIELGKFKPSMKLTFGYEFFLRMTYHSLRVMTIPKFGYKHLNMREGGIFWNYKNGNHVMSENEVRFWIDTAKKEYYFIDDREIKYDVQMD
jgi:hypothetical protein